MALEDRRRYNVMEPVLNTIIKEFISLPENDVQRNNIILNDVLDSVIKHLKEKDKLFNELFNSNFYGGSYYDGLKVCKPNEYDIDVLLRLPKLLGPTIITSNLPGYIHVKFETLEDFRRQPYMVSRYKGVEKFIGDNNHLITSGVLSWFESVLFRTCQSGTIQTSIGRANFRIIKSGPAFTLKVNGNFNGEDVELDIDLVPCFEFGEDKWPRNGFRQNPLPRDKPYFFIVPKPLKDTSTSKANRYWRLSFQQQEKELLAGKEKLKPSIKLLKKMRDEQNHNIASYFLKTILLWQVEERDEVFWKNNSLSYVFMMMLKEYHRYLVMEQIPYFWNSRNNLIKNLAPDAKANLRNRLRIIIDDIERHLDDDKFAVAKYLLSPSEVIYLKRIMSDQQRIIQRTNYDTDDEDSDVQRTSQERSNCIIL